MSGVLITGLVVVAGAIALWLVVRYVVFALIYGRRVVITARVGAAFVAAVVFAIALIGRNPVSVVVVVGGAVLAAVIFVVGLWFVFGATTDYILDRAEFVARGLLMKYERTGRAVSGEAPGAGGVSVLGGLLGIRLLRVTTSSDSKKSLLFSQGLAKFLGTRDRGGS